MSSIVGRLLDIVPLILLVLILNESKRQRGVDAAGKKGDREIDGHGINTGGCANLPSSRCCHLVHLFEHMEIVNYYPSC